MSTAKKAKSNGDLPELGGFLGGLGSLIEKLGELAEKGKELRESGEFGDGEKLRGVYGVSIRTNLGQGRERDGGVTVEPFGNVRKDDQTGRAKVHEVAEPLVDLFDEAEFTRVIVEMPGIGDDDIQLELNDDILTIVAERGPRKYRKEVLLPAVFDREKMSRSCRNGVLEIKLAK